MAQTYNNLGDLFTAIANAIRGLKGTSGTIVADTFPAEINAIPKKSSSDLTVNGATVTAPAGYYASAASKSVASGSATAPASISGSSATISSSTTYNTITLTKNVSVTPSVTAGYVSSGTAGNSSVSLTASVTTQSAYTYDASAGTDRTIYSGTYITGAQKIRAIRMSGITAANIKDGANIRVGDTGSPTRLANVTGTFTDASTVSTGQTAATADQMLSGYSAWVDGEEVKGNIVSKSSSDITSAYGSVIVPAGYYPSGGAKSDADLTAANVKDGVDIFGVTGTFTDASTVSSGQTAATASQIANGYSAWVDGAEVKGNIPSKSSSDLTASGATVTAPAGYYASAASKSVDNGSVTIDTYEFSRTPNISISASGLITAGANNWVQGEVLSATVTPGYVSSVANGTLKSKIYNTKQLTTQAAQTITPTTSNQTIASGKYLTGTQTILGDANLVADNIKKDVTIFGVTGTYSGGVSPNDRLVFTSASSFTLASGTTKTKHWNGTMEYSTNGTTWSTWSGSQITSGLKDGEYYIALRGTGNSYVTNNATGSYAQVAFTFTGGDNAIYCHGDVDALLDYSTLALGMHPSRAMRTFSGLFYGQTRIKNTPSMSSPYIAAYGCQYMYYGCTGITECCAMPVSDLGIYACMAMFQGCSNLETLPLLPATIIINYAYNTMFAQCAKIQIYTGSASGRTAFTLPAGGHGISSDNGSLTNMFQGTGGSFTGTPTINTTYYTSNQIVS